MNHRTSAAQFASFWLETQEAILKAAREQLREEVDREAAGLGITGTARPRERGDLSEEEREDREAVAMLEALQDLLCDVEEALRRIEAGTYETCLECGCAIRRARLAALPSALRCARCQAAFESEGKDREVPVRLVREEGPTGRAVKPARDGGGEP